MLPVNFECPFDITKAYEEEGRWIVEGYAATSDFDMQEDIITEGAIRASASDLLENSTVLHNHNPDEAIGKVLSSDARPDGLLLKILISKTRPDIWQQVREGVLNKFSVRGKILEARKEWVDRLKKYARLILKMRLVEVSLVAVPANPKARAIRWYVEKAREAFETAGGRIETSKGGSEMKDDVVVEEELLEGTGELRKDAQPPKGFPPPELLEKVWNAHVEKAGLAGKGEEAVSAAWIEFCKEQHYPYPYPYPYPRPGMGFGSSTAAILELVDQLIGGEKDEERKRLLGRLRALVTGSSYPAPTRKEESAAAQAEPSVEKAGRKISTERLARLKKLVEELKGFIDEVEVPPGAEKKATEGASPPDKLAEIEATVSRIAKTLGIEKEAGKDKKPALPETVESLAKRLEALEKAPGVRTSIEGQEALAGEQGAKSIWKGMV
ncbi:MAG: HK97 family phage prohead protease [Planctomycetota bacterium]